MELIGTAVEIAKCCAPYLRKKIDFVFYTKNVQNVKHQMDKLVYKKAEIVERLDLAERQYLHIPKPHVADWLNKVGILETETNSINWVEGNQKCFMGLCVNWVDRYKLNKVVQQKDSEVRNLIEEVQRFEVLEISTPPLAPPVEQMNVYGYMETDSSNFLIQKISELIVSESVKAIGVWGMGGVGKTTLVKRLNNHLASYSISDKVILVTMSQDPQAPDWKQIHKQIAERIGLNLIVYENEDLRVNMLSMALKKEKSVLFIVDNVWNFFDLSLLGISDGLSDLKYKIIITTRNQSVCDQMGVGKLEQFELKPMSKDDAWKLFQAKAGYIANLPTLQPMAIELCGKCDGSPLAICTLSSTLKGDESKASWKDALRVLSSSDESQSDGILKPVFTSIEFSFNRLASEEVKLCFLYCCSYPEGSRVLIDDIRTYDISQRVIRERSLKEASERVDAFVDVLRKSSLLSVADDRDFGRYVLLHDLVRQMGLWIASSKKYGFIVKSGQKLVELPRDEILLSSKYLSLKGSKINKLPNILCCPNLLALDMSDMGCNQEFEIFKEFFAQTKKLQFLDLSRIKIGASNIPNSLCDLIHLCTLDMRGLRNLRDISSIGKLKFIEILILDDTGIQELPKELGNLNTLRMFHLKNTHKLKTVAPNIFNQLRSLEELNMENSFNLWERNGENGVNASLSEIFGLSQLTTLHLDIINPLCLQDNYMCASLINLDKFRIVVATSGNSIDTERSYMRCLSLVSIPFGFGNWICKLFEVSEYVNLNGSDVLETLPYQQIMGFNCLTELRISNLGLMKHVIDCHLLATKYENDVFPSLEQLVLIDMDNLEYVCDNGSVGGAFFSKLNVIKIRNCKNLKILFKGCMDQALQNLTDIQIHGCDQLEGLTNVEGPNYFQKLKRIEVKDCGNLEIMLAAEADWGCLETINVSRCKNLKNIFHTSVFPQNLKHLTVKVCKNMTTSVSALIKRSFSSIETVKIIDCNPGNVKYLLSTTVLGDLSSKNVLENLKVLDVRGFDGRGIFHDPMSQCSLQKLVEVKISRCDDLTSIWGSVETFALIKRRNIFEIGWCDKLMLKEVFLPDGMGDEFVLRVEKLFVWGLSQLTTLELFPRASLRYVKFLFVYLCENLKYLLPHSGAYILNHLDELVIDECCNLKNIVSQDGVSNYDVAHHNNLIYTSETSSSITNITGLLVENCNLLDLKNLGVTLIRISVLTLKRLPQLESLTQLQSLYIVGQRCDTIRVIECENLEKLHACEDANILNDCENLVIYDCPKLLTFIAEEEIVPSPSRQEPAFTGSTFRNLNILFIGDCRNLKNIFSITTARSLIHLEQIYVVNCEEMTEIVASDSVEANYADLFPRLKFVCLFWLPNMECFCRGNTTLILLSLKSVFVWECPNLVILEMGPSSAPNLEEIMGKDEWFDRFEKGSSFRDSRLSSLFSTITYSDAREICSMFDSVFDSTAYTTKLRKTVESHEDKLENEPEPSSQIFFEADTILK